MIQLDSNNQEILDNFILYLNKKKLQPSSRYMYEQAIRGFMRTNPELDNLEYYNNYLVEKTIEKRSGYIHSAFILFIRFYIEDKSKRMRMVKALIRPQLNQPKRHRKYLTYQERKEVIESLQQWKHRLMAKMQYYTGMRIGEILRLQKGDITYEAIHDNPDNPDEERIAMLLMVTQKGGQKSPVWIMHKDLQDDIDDYTLSQFNDIKYYFVDRSDRYPTKTDDIIKINTNYHWYWRDLKDALKAHGYSSKDWATHDFRRNIGQDIWMATKDPISVKRFLRHKRFDTTLRYLDNAGLQNRDLTDKMAKIYSNKK